MLSNFCIILGHLCIIPVYQNYLARGHPSVSVIVNEGNEAFKCSEKDVGNEKRRWDYRLSLGYPMIA